MRKGVSFTLTMVVTGVILIMTALSIITLGGSSIGGFFDQIGGQQEEQVQEAAIRNACQDFVREINNNYCELWVNPDCSDPTFTRSSTDKQTATSLGCNWQENWDEVQDQSNPWDVTVEGNAFNCADEGFVEPRPTCPAENQLN